MRYDRDMRRARQGEEERWGREEYGTPDESTFHGYAMGYSGGALRSRGSFEAGQLHSGLNPRDEFEFRWGNGYVGGRGYGGTNYDLRHGYRVGGIPRYGLQRPSHPPPPPLPSTSSSPATRGGYSWSEYEPEMGELYGPARYGYGPYFERLRRRRRSDEEIRSDVEDALFYDTWVDADSIEVEVEDGIVTLRGTLPNFDEVRFATDDAWDVDGVRGVRSEFEVAMEGETERGGEEAEPKKGSRAARSAQRTASGGRAASSGTRSSSSRASKQSGRSSRAAAGKEAMKGKKGGAGKESEAEE